MPNDFDELDDLMGLDDDAEFGLDEEDELGLDEESEFGLEDEDEGDFGDEGEDEDDFGDEDEDDFGADDDDMEDMRATSDDPEDPEDDSGPDINGESGQFGIAGATVALLAAGGAAAAGGGLVIGRRARYTRQQRIFRNRYRRAVKRADWRRGGAGVRRRLRNTWRRLRRLWGKLSDKRKVGLKSPGQTRKAVVKLYGPLPQDEGKGGRGSVPVYPTAGIAAGLIRPPTSAPVPPLTPFQSQEVSQQAQATNYAQRWSSPPVRAPQYMPGVAAAAVAPVPTGTALDQLDSMTNERLWHIAGGNGLGIFSTPAARMRARQILRSRGVDTAPTNPASVRSGAPGASMPGTVLDQLESMTNDRLMHIASGNGLGVFSSPAARMRARQILRSRGIDTAATNPASRRYDGPVNLSTPRVPLLRPAAPVQQASIAPPAPLSQRFRIGPRPGSSVVPPVVQAAIRPAMARPLSAGPAMARSLPVGPAIRPGMAANFPRLASAVRPGASANMGFDTYGIDAGAVAPIVADGYSVVPDFSTLGMSAIKEHPIKSAVSIVGLFTAGVLLAKPVGDLIRNRVG